MEGVMVGMVKTNPFQNTPFTLTRTLEQVRV